MDYALEITDLYKQIENFQLSNVNIKLEPGYIMGLIGPNGAGKTTLILTLLGLYRPKEGTIKIFGYDMQQQEREAKAQVGFVLDENPYLEHLSPKDNASMYGRYYPNYSKKTFDHYCKEFELDVKKPMKKLSKGNQMKFQLAFALSHDAKLLVLDEPTAGLDPVFRRELIDIMSDIISEGDRSILYSTHLTEELDKIADYITFLLNGRQLFSSLKEDLMTQYALVRGSQKEITSLDPCLLVGKRVGENYAEALVRRETALLPSNLSLLPPTMDDILYYTVNG